MTTKKIDRIVSPRAPHFVGDGFRVHNFIPSIPGLSMERMDPFIMMDYNSTFNFTPRENPRGVDVHPHRGFETVTIAYKGKIAHHDSRGNHGVIGQGEVQWMTAASGILHKEYHEEKFSQAGGDFQMVQLWVNLPAKYKMSEPKYQGLTRASIPKHLLPNQAGHVEVIAGNFESTKGAASTFSPIELYNVHLQNGAQCEVKLPPNQNSALLVVEGTFVVNGQHVSTDHLALFHNDGEGIALEAIGHSVALVLSGEPLKEPIAAHGPFVMNHPEEIKQAMLDYSAGAFGHLE